MGQNRSDEAACLFYGPKATSVWPIRAHGLGFREGIKGASDCCPGRRRAVLVPLIGFVVGLGFAIFRDGSALADAEDCEEAGQAVQETPSRPLQVPQGTARNSFVNVEMRTRCLRCRPYLSES